MIVTPIGAVPDTGALNAAPRMSPIPAPDTDPADLFNGLLRAFADGDNAFRTAQSAENAVVAGQGDIQTMIFERARADAILQIASGAASHLTQSLSTILQMQV